MVTGLSSSYDHHQTIEHHVFTGKLYNIPITHVTTAFVQRTSPGGNIYTINVYTVSDGGLPVCRRTHNYKNTLRFK